MTQADSVATQVCEVAFFSNPQPARSLVDEPKKRFARLINNMALGQATSSALSPYAEIFVPQHFKKGVATKESQREAVRNQQLTEVPKYLTNCYPFVTDDGPLGKNIHWPAAGRGFSSHNLYAENVLPSCQGYIYISNTPYDYNAGISSCSVDSGILPQFAPTDVDAYRSDHDVQSKKKKSRYSSGVQKKQGAGKVSSIGIRNEPACRLNKPHRSWTMSSALTDAAVQTDLSPDVANLTLSEKPNSLFHSCKMRRSQNKLNPPHNVTDSEVDSDSGYSSPLHRRNLVSNGTPVAPELACLSTPVNECAASYGMTYASIAQRVSKPVPSLTNCRVDMPPDKKVVSENTDTKSTEEGRKKKKRNRKKKKRNDSKPESVASNTSPTSTIVGDQTLHFEDEDEFPELGSVVSSVSLDTLQTRLSYSEKLKGSPVMKQEFTSAQSFEIVSVGSSENKVNRISDGRNVRRRYKRQEIANRAAEEELAEITLEQQMLRQLNISKKPVPKASSMKTAGSLVPGVLPVPATITKQPQQQSGKKSKQPIALDIAAMIDALEKRQNDSHKQQHKQLAKDKILKKGPIGNVLDSSAPTIKRGKEKENPKPKKPSPLKKVILKEREEKKRLRLLEVDPSNALTSSSVPVGIGVVNAESDLSQDATSSKGDIGAVTPASADLSPVSQTSPISMSPLSPGTSPISSGVNSPITGIVDKGMNTAILKIHSRRFREYCNQILDKEIDNCCAAVLQDLVSFQDRMFHRDPIKAKMRRRIVLGLREVTKHLKLNKLKCVIISPNLEKIQSKGGLDDALNNILNLCTDQNIPFVFALGRRALGRACAKLVPVSVVGIFNYEGSEENFQKLMDLTEKARQSYKDMVALIEKDIQENAGQMHCTTSQVFSHMGHSRTPSGCSVISFTSSILSEPISENYPHSEPETDSKGNEIVQSQQEKNSFNGGGDNIMHSATKHTDSTVCQHQLALHEIDDGNEADTEDCNEVTMKSESESAAEIRTAILPECDDDTNSLNTGLDTLDELPHIDSIHTMNYDLNAEILSQHSVRTVDTSEALSTHSSKTVGEGSSTIIADGCSEQGRLEKSKSRESPINLTKVKTVEKEQRIQDWVDASQTCLEELEQTDEQKVAVVSSPVRVNSPEPNTVSSKVITCTDPLQESITNNL